MRNWSKFQHYKDRCPPWIKLHRALLNDVKFMMLTPEQRATLMLIWVLAAEDNGSVPDDPQSIAWRLRVPAVDLESLVSAGFLERCRMLAPCTTETETEAYTAETERETKSVSVLEIYTGEVFKLIDQRNGRTDSNSLREQSSADFDRVSHWYNSGIPLRVALTAIRGIKRAPNARYCHRAVLEEFDRWRKAVGA